METKNVTKEEDGVTRHCAYCLNICGLSTKLCGGCKKRAYCSIKVCQIADWSSKGNGQRPVNWCRRHEHGEEDVDWEVVPVVNKGLGIRAKKLIPAGMKIIVEPTFFSPNDHSGFKDLEPEGGSLLQKFMGNYLLGANREGLFNVALRIARVNHAFQPNAAVIYEETARVAILFAQKDIHPGQEICISYYTPFFSLLPIPSSNMYPGMNPEWDIEEELNFIKNETLSTYGITCPADCSCNDPNIWNLVQEGIRQLHKTIITLANQLQRTEEVLAAGDKLP